MDMNMPVEADRPVDADQPVDLDQQLFQEIVAQLRNNRALHFVKLNLQVEDGIVTISGRVNSLAERNAVERAARRVAGIKSLILEIRAAAFPITVNST
jgi:osmotically-inducible protein OsmY